MTTTIQNDFTGYTATIKTQSLPSVATIKKHIRKSKASDCKSCTTIDIDGVQYIIANIGRGDQLVTP